MSSRGHRGKFGNRGKSHGRGMGNRGRGSRDNSSQSSIPKNQSNNLQSKNESEFEKLTEKEVGIKEFISTLPGFTGILKFRFSDFQVNEIDLDGNVAKLTSLEAPREVYDAVESENTPDDLIPQEKWEKIKKLIAEEDRNTVVEINVTNLGKDERKRIYEAVKRNFKSKIVGSTVSKGDEKHATFRVFNRKQNFDNRQAWPSSREGEFVHFLLYKEHMDTMSAVLKLSECLKMNPSKFAYAGVKDRRAKTTQWVSVRKVEPYSLVSRTKNLNNLHVGNFCFKQSPLKLGHLKGNRFRIALRDVQAPENVINDALESLKKSGFINYFGLQRFGNNKDVPTHEIGVQLLKGNWKQAIDLILKPRTLEQDVDVLEAKRIYQQTGNATLACSKLKKKTKSIESKLLHGLMSNNKNDYVNALENIPRNTRLMYIHAFQSFIWNEVVSRRIKSYGLKPVVGDLVIEGELENLEDCLVASDDENILPVESEENIIEQKKKRDIQVKVLKEEDLNNYSIRDVVLPLPGYDVIYPENEVKNWYKELLAERDLKLEMPRQKVRVYTLSGDYRKVIQYVSNLSWYIIKYKNHTDNLIRSDYEELMSVDEPVDVPNGKYRGLVVDFCLSASSYATMALREVMKIDTCSKIQISLGQASKKEETISTKTTETSSENKSSGDTKSADVSLDRIITEADSTSEVVTITHPSEDSLIKFTTITPAGEDSTFMPKNKPVVRVEESLKAGAELIITNDLTKYNLPQVDELSNSTKRKSDSEDSVSPKKLKPETENE